MVCFQMVIKRAVKAVTKTRAMRRTTQGQEWQALVDEAVSLFNEAPGRPVTSSTWNPLSRWRRPAAKRTSWRRSALAQVTTTYSTLSYCFCTTSRTVRVECWAESTLASLESTCSASSRLTIKIGNFSENANMQISLWTRFQNWHVHWTFATSHC